MPETDKGWLVLVLTVTLGAILFYSLFTESAEFGGLSVFLMLGTLILTPLAIYFERQHVPSVSRWKPSRAYYLLTILNIGVIGWLITVYYLWKRHRYVGTP